MPNVGWRERHGGLVFDRTTGGQYGQYSLNKSDCRAFEGTGTAIL
jgi:hypothetical protein